MGMADLVLRDVEGSLVEALAHRAQGSGLSVSDEAKALLVHALALEVSGTSVPGFAEGVALPRDPTDVIASIKKLRRQTPRPLTDSTPLIRADRDG
jgi:plasmid stability protein